MCKSAPHSRQITMPAHHHSVFSYRPTNSIKALKAAAMVWLTVSSIQNYPKIQQPAKFTNKTETIYTQCCLVLGFPNADEWDVGESVCGFHCVASLRGLNSIAASSQLSVEPLLLLIPFHYVSALFIRNPQSMTNEHLICNNTMLSLSYSGPEK